MSDPIAERMLYVVDGDERTEVAVRIYAPVPNGSSWECHFEMGWPEGTLKRSAGGYDSVQALDLAMRMIGIDLYTSEAHESGRLVWQRPGGGYGFPLTKNIRDLLIGDDKDFF